MNLLLGMKWQLIKQNPSEKRKSNKEKESVKYRVAYDCKKFLMK